MKQKIKRYAVQFVKEIIPVTVGILIALFIENWNSTRKDKMYVSQIFSTISNELNESKEDIDYMVVQQESLIDSVNFYVDNKKVSILDILMRSNGFSSPNIKLNAWDAVSSSKIDLVDYKKIQALSYIEEQKLILKSKNDFLMSFVYNNLNETNKDKKMTLKMLLIDVVQTEKATKRVIELFEKLEDK